MTAPAKSEHPQHSDAERRGGMDAALSPEELEDLEAFRRMQKIGLRVSHEWLGQLLKPID